MNNDPSYVEIAKETHRVKTEHVFPPIPIRSMDWMAYYDGQEESGKQGYGGTEREAVDDLLNNWPK